MLAVCTMIRNRSCALDSIFSVPIRLRLLHDDLVRGGDLVERFVNGRLLLGGMPGRIWQTDDVSLGAFVCFRRRSGETDTS